MPSSELARYHSVGGGEERRGERRKRKGKGRGEKGGKGREGMDLRRYIYLQLYN